MIVRGATILWLAAVWVALWGDLSAANVLSGLAVGSLAVLAVPLGGRERRTRVRPLRLVRFVAYFAVKLLQANLAVAWEVITPRTWRLNEGIVAVRLRSASGATLAILANSISLTPGTIVVEARADPPVLYIHTLQLREPDTVRAQVLHLEWLLTRALERVERPTDGEAQAAAVEAAVGR